VTVKPTHPARLSVALSGKMVQFNITLFILVLLILGVLFMCDRSNNALIIYSGTIVVLVAFLALVAFVIYFYLKQKSRPMDGQAVAISMKNEAGQEIAIRNPPDSFFEREQLNTLVRSMLVGYDENLCPDGQVIGKASEQNYRYYSDKEKEEFIKRHREEIKGKKVYAARLLAQEGKAEDQPLLPMDKQSGKT
jgi:hypothetical protein